MRVVGRAAVMMALPRGELGGPSSLQRGVPEWSSLNRAQTRTEAERVLDRLKGAGMAEKWRSAELQPQYTVSIAQLETTTRCQGELGDAFGVFGGQQVEKLALLFFGILASSALSAVAAQVTLTWLPEIWRFVVVQVLCFAPFGALIVGISLPEEVQVFLSRWYALVFPAYRARLVRHEAGHLVVGHLLGLPVRSVAANAASSAVSFWDTRREENEAQRLPLDSTNRPPRYFNTYSAVALDVLAVVSLAGVMAEIDEWGDSEGGAADLGQLQAVYDSMPQQLAPTDQMSQTRWAALQAHLILKRNADQLEAVVAALTENDSDVPACLQALEETDSVHTRESNRVEPSAIERLFSVKEPRIIDDDGTATTRREQQNTNWQAPWTSEDVPYLAAIVTASFLFYAANGGITLH